MADIFDQISSGSGGDVFDQVAPEKTDIFDQIAPSKPTSFMDRVKSNPLVKKGLGLAKSYVSGTLPYEASKTALETSNKIDTKIKDFRSNTVPNLISPTRDSIDQTAAETGKVPYGKIAARTAAETASEILIPTTKEAAAGALISPFIKPVVGIATKGLEQVSPKFAANQLVKREVGALGRIQAANLTQPEFKSTQILGNVGDRLKEATKDFLLPATKKEDGTIKQVWSHHEYDNTGKMIPSKDEIGYLDSSGKFYTVKDINNRIIAGEDITSLLKGTKTVPNLRRQFIHEEVDKLTKQTVGDLSLPKELEPKATPGLPGVTKRSFKEDLLKQVLPEESALRRQGLNGKQLADDVMNYSQDSQVMAGKLQAKMLPELMKLPEDIRAKIPDYLEPRPGETRPNLAGEAKRVADTMRNQLKAVGRFLEKQDIEVIRNGEKSKFFAKNEFFPRSLDIDKVSADPAVYQDELQHLLKSKQVDSLEEGKQVLDAAMKARTNIFSPEDFTNFYGAKKLATIEKPRVYTFKNVTNDPIENYVNYTNSVSRRINHIKYFGQHGELLNERLAGIGNEGGDANFAQGVMNRFLKQQYEDDSAGYIIRQLKSFQGLTKLSRSAIPNLQQGVVNSYIKSQSESATLKGFKNSLSAEGVEFAKKAGVVGNKEVDKYMEQIAGMKTGSDATTLEELSNKLGSLSGFKKSEELNRIQAANIGREYINEVAMKFIKNPEGKIGTRTLRDELENYRINPDQLIKRGKLTLNEELKAANKFVGETQFGTKPLGLPAIYNSSPAGKLAGQFSMFPIQQGKLAKDALVQHPLKTLPIIGATSVGIGGPLGMLSNVTAGKAPIEKKKSPGLTMANYVIQSVLNSGALGKVGGIATATDYGPEAVEAQMVGPTVSEGGKLLYNIRQATKGKPKPLTRQVLSQVPFIGKAAANVFLPSKKK
jgi:hypothetical protein